MDMTGNIALVTGASRGIGAAVSYTLAELGMTVIAASRSGDYPEYTPDADAKPAPSPAGEERSGPIMTATLDIHDEAAVRAVFQRVYSAHGRLDVVVNNAGIGRFGPLAGMDIHDFDEVMAVNARGTFLCCREALRLMQPQRTGYIVNISSVVGFKGYADQSAYTASKHAVMGITKSLAKEAQPYGIRVSAILPGGVDTAFVTQARPDLDRSKLMHPEDIADTVRYLVTLPPRAVVDQIYIRRQGSTPFY